MIMEGRMIPMLMILMVFVIMVATVVVITVMIMTNHPWCSPAGGPGWPTLRRSAVTPISLI
jgi:hypothetical protein